MSTPITYGTRVRATFQPQRIDDITPVGQAIIGQRFEWQAAFILDADDHDDYAGQWQMRLGEDDWRRTGVLWVHEGDLADIEVLADIDPAPEPVPVFRMPYDEDMSTEPSDFLADTSRPTLMASRFETPNFIRDSMRDMMRDLLRRLPADDPTLLLWQSLPKAPGWGSEAGK